MDHDSAFARRLDREILGLRGRVVWLALVTGAVGGLVGVAYLWVLRVSQHLLGPERHHAVALVATLGGVGVAVAVLTRVLGSPGDVELMVDNIHVSGTGAGLRRLRALLPISWLCIGAGGAMGPEAPLVQTTGSLASWGARRARFDVAEARVVTITGMAAAFTVLFGAPLGATVFALEILHRRGLQYFEALLPSVLGALAGYAAAVVAADLGLSPVWRLPSVTHLEPVDLAWAVTAGLVGAALGALFVATVWVLRTGMRRLAGWARPALGGLVLAGLGLASPYALTYGEAQLGAIVHRPGATVSCLCLAALAKIAGTSVTLSSEWRGGFIIPLFFVGACVGRAIHGAVPSANEAVLVAGLMAATNATVTKTPLGSTLVVTEMGGLRLLPTSVLATMVAFLVSGRVALIHTQRERDVAPATD